MNNEIWKEIPGFEGYYSVSNKGRVKSLERIITDTKNHTYKIPEKILKQIENNSGKGYFRVSLSKNSKIKFYHIHQLVMHVFVGPQPKKIEVRHLDGNCKNNKLENLCYGTRSQNISDAKIHGTFPLFENRPGAKLNKEIVKKIALEKGLNAELGKKYKIGCGVIRQIRTGETWAEHTIEERKQNPYHLLKSYKPRKIKKDACI